MGEHTWQLFAWWDDAVFTARLEAARTGLRKRVRRSTTLTGFWVVEEATA
jgi:hypothetical protein